MTMEERLRYIFSHYGLIFSVIVRRSGLVPPKPGEETEKNAQAHVSKSSCYAIANFYSARDAGHALASLSGQLFMRGQCLKIKYCSRLNQHQKQMDHLYIIRAKELANHYLGFNGWSTEIVKFESSEVSETDMLEADDNSEERVEYICVVKLRVPEHGITVEGVGIGTGIWPLKDLLTKGSAICKAKKYAHQRALETAFSKLLLVVLPNGKVYVEVDTRKMSPLDHLTTLDMDNLLEVKELDEAPPSDEEENFTIDNTADLDDVNIQVLAHLHNT